MKPKTALLFYSMLIVAITTLAYLRLIPTKLNAIPHFDSAGHFVLYGIWGWFFARAYPKNFLKIGGFNIPLGTLMATTIAIVEESLQTFSSARSCDIFDFLWGFTGIMTACLLLNRRRVSKRNNNSLSSET